LISASLHTPDLFQTTISTGETVILAGGYLFEVERRGYLKAGEFVPKVAQEETEACVRSVFMAGNISIIAPWRKRWDASRTCQDTLRI
jgi:hypothetical protein